jgi:pyruvate dehydrogenase E2 component (dihydrolipoamide acetyltransferase)
MIQDVTLPEVSESVTQADVVKVLVAAGEAVKVDQPLLEVETDKALFELPSPFAGTVAEVMVKAGDRIRVGQALLRLETSGEASDREPSGEGVPALAGSAAPKPPPPPAAPEISPAPRAAAPAPLPPAPAGPASPAVRKLARELGVDLASVGGTGPRGRVTLDDVKARAKVLVERPQGPPGARSPALPDFAKWGPVRREAFSTVRRITADAMAHAWSTVPQVTQYDGADVTDLEAFRAKFGKRVEAAGGKLTVTALLTRVVASALRAFPAFNASLDPEHGETIYKDYVHVGVAVDTDRGLLVPVVRDADRKNVTELAREIRNLAERARSRKLLPDEMEGGTFTLSNLGGIGGTAFAPIVYWPQVAILGVSRSEVRPVWREGRFEPRTFLPVSLSYDHRLIDGADGARFLRWICEALEEPWLLALEG